MQLPKDLKKEYWNEVCSDLAPSASLLWNYKNEIYSWEKFKEKYNYQMRTYPKARERIKLLYLDYVSYGNYDKNTVTFICYCPDETKCHRSLLKEIVVDAINFLSVQTAANS
jgi:uncharacterized protein YeaO (DUF488 family)